MMNAHMPAGSHVAPAMPVHPQRRQNEMLYHQPPPHPHLHHPPYPTYHHPQHHAAYPPPQYPPQWYPPYQAYVLPPPRPYQPTSPLVVSSHPHMQPLAPLVRPYPYLPSIRTPPLQTQAPESPRLTDPLSPRPSRPTPAAKPATPQSASTASQPESPARLSFRATLQARQVTDPESSYLKLPWYSVPDATFPFRAPRRRRRRLGPQRNSVPVELPLRENADTRPEPEKPEPEEARSESSTIAPPTELETPATSQAPSEADSTHPTTPSSTISPSSSATVKAQPTHSHTRTLTKPIVPIIPILPKPAHTPSHSQSRPLDLAPPVAAEGEAALAAGQAPPSDASVPTEAAAVGPTSPTIDQTPFPVSPPKPKSWADLVRSKGPSSALPTGSASVNGSLVANSAACARPESLSDALSMYAVASGGRIAFLEPRGLVNTGNMCYMNSILQVLVFCFPFYDFLDEVSKRAMHTFKSETPLIDSMIMFMKEFHIIDTAVSVDQLKMRLKSNELEQFGDPFVPEYVYDVINRLPRFSTMRRGHQQDAEEFLGFLLEGLHDECVQVIRNAGSSIGGVDLATADAVDSTTSSPDAGWQEVGPKQKAAVTRSSGTIVTESPITKMFGGKLRSEFRVPGLKNSVTLEPYQPLPLDIGAPNVHNITDALRGLTRSEVIHGDFNSPRGPGTTATKQVFIETLPPVLILHLKRFQYDNTGGTQKIWKRVGYPLELEIPKEVFPPHKRTIFAAKGGWPTYRLISVVYHHGKNASDGHYTVDVRRQDGREWIRLDDTIIRRVRSEDVAEGGSEEDPKVLAQVLEQHSRDQNAGRNIFKQAGFGDDDADGDDTRGWSQVNGSAAGGAATATTPNAKKLGGANGNGSATPSTAGKETPRDKYSVRDNKVAYILLYQRMK